MAEHVLNDNLNAIAYRPEGVCAKGIFINLDENDRIVDIYIQGGCDGNGKAISKLLQGKSRKHVISLLKGITCGKKNTSCADQIAKALSK